MVSPMKWAFLAFQFFMGAVFSLGLLILLSIVLLRNAGAFVRESADVFTYVVELFTSGFTQGTAPKGAVGWTTFWPQAVLTALFIAMIVSLFFPDSRTFLHSLALVTAITLLACAGWMREGMKMEIVCLPLMALWYLYYASCLWWKPSIRIG
jgi:hypothetical protein